MTKLNRKHGIEVGSKVKVLSCEGSKEYRNLIGAILTVKAVLTENEDDYDLIRCEGYGSGQYPSRFELVLPEVVPEPNGVDGNGKPTHFALTDLKPFQRIVTNRGKRAIVALQPSGEPIIVYGGSHGGFDYAAIGAGHHHIAKVYENAGYARSLDVSKNGNLLWESKDVSAMRAEAANAVAEAKGKYEAAVAALAAI